MKPDKKIKAAYSKKVFSPAYLDGIAKSSSFQVRPTCLRQIGDGVYVNIPIKLYARIYRQYPLKVPVLVSTKGGRLVISKVE